MSTQATQPIQTLPKEVNVSRKISLSKIMVLTDFSEVSDLALQYAVTIARRYDARIYLLTSSPLICINLQTRPLPK